MKLICFLGITEYKDNTIYFDDCHMDEKVSGKIPALEICKKYKDKINNIVCITTNSVKTRIINYKDGDKSNIELFESSLKQIFDIEEDELNDLLKFEYLDDYNEDCDIVKEFKNKLYELLNSKDEIILDISTGYREWPILSILELNYLFLSNKRDVNLSHIYYGMYNQATSNTKIVDLIKEYNNQWLGRLLSDFNDSLLIDVDTINNFLDDNSKEFVELIRKFNFDVQCCHFKNIKYDIRDIKSKCNSLKNSDNEKLNNIYKDIISEFDFVEKGNEFDFYKGLIDLFIKRKQWQIAITFIDVLFRHIIVSNIIKQNDNINDIKSYYNLTQTIKDQLFSVKLNDKKEKVKSIGLRKSHLTKYYLKNSKKNNKIINNLIKDDVIKIIKSYYDNYRNSINHGTGIKANDEKEITVNLNDVLLSLENFNNISMQNNWDVMEIMEIELKQ